MQTLSILIVNDNIRARKIVSYAIDKFNNQSEDVRLLIVGEAESVDEAEAIMKLALNPVQFVFLDYELKGGKKGIELSRKYPHLGYAVMSCHPAIFSIIEMEKRTNAHDYMEHVTEGQNYNIDLMIRSIKQFLEHFKRQ